MLGCLIDDFRKGGGGILWIFIASCQILVHKRSHLLSSQESSPCSAKRPYENIDCKSRIICFQRKGKRNKNAVNITSHRCPSLSPLYFKSFCEKPHLHCLNYLLLPLLVCRVNFHKVNAHSWLMGIWCLCSQIS